MSRRVPNEVSSVGGGRGELSLSCQKIDISHIDCNGVPSSRSGQAACLCQGYLYVHGGRSAGRLLKDFHRLNTDNNAWEIVPCDGSSCARPGMQEAHLMLSYQGRLFLFTSVYNSFNQSQFEVWIFTPEWEAWTKANPAFTLSECRQEKPLGRRDCAGAMIYSAGKAYIYGGFIDVYALTSDQLLEYDLELFCWKTVPVETKYGPRPPALYSHSCVAYRGNLYIFGGIANRRSQNILWKFDLSTSEWSRYSGKSAQRTFPAARFGHSAVMAANSMFILGGQREGNVLYNDLWQYSVTRNTWNQVVVSDLQLTGQHLSFWLPGPNPRSVGLPTVSKITPPVILVSHACDVDERRPRSVSKELLIHEQVTTSDEDIRRLENEGMELQEIKKSPMSETSALSLGTPLRNSKWSVFSEQEVSGNNGLDRSFPISSALSPYLFSEPIELKVMSSFASSQVIESDEEQPENHLGTLLIVGGETPLTTTTRRRQSLLIRSIQIPSSFSL